MKKFVVFCLAMTMSVATLAGCGEKPVQSVSVQLNEQKPAEQEETKAQKDVAKPEVSASVETEPTSVEVSPEEQKEPEAPSSADDNATLEAVFSTPEVRDAFESQMDQVRESMKEQYSSIEVEIKGNVLTYIYTFAYQVPEDTDFSATSDSLMTQYTLLAESFHQSVDTDEPITVGARFYNNDGTLLFESSASK